MFATGLIVFRETLEAALFIGIMAAATRGLAGRARAIVWGVAAGVVGALLIAALTERISNAVDGTGQEWLNVIVLGLAFAMLTWHVVWSSRHGRELAGQAKRLGSHAKAGDTSMWAISLAIALIVLREGAETVLFVTGAFAGSDVPPALVQSIDAAAPALSQQIDLTQTIDLTQNSNSADALPVESAPVESTPVVSVRDVTLGGLAGLGLGLLVGLILYFGLVKISVGRLFAVTNVFVVLLAAGMMGQMGAKLVQAQVVPSGIDPLWDTSTWFASDGVIGTFLQALVGYSAQPSMTHVAFFVLGLLIILLAARWAKAKI